jgi:hypothetical protein
MQQMGQLLVQTVGETLLGAWDEDGPANLQFNIEGELGSLIYSMQQKGGNVKIYFRGGGDD